jgi:hypothetical protein
VFGSADEWHFEIGQPLDSDIPICIDLRPLVERSNGVFGKSGTGKSFLTRLLLAGIIRADVASNLVFDMHSEYAHEVRAERLGVVKGLRQIFGADRVLLYTLDPDSTRARGAGGCDAAEPRTQLECDGRRDGIHGPTTLRRSLAVDVAADGRRPTAGICC